MLRRLLLYFRKADRFHLIPEHFPESTRNLLTVEQILAMGALPLGIKSGTIVNFGLLDFRNLITRDTLSGIASQQGKKAHFYVVEPREFWDVLQNCYRVSPASVYQEEIAPSLRAFITERSPSQM